MILDGTMLAKKKREDLLVEIKADPRTVENPPHLVAILVGYNAASEVYINMKRKACDEVGIMFSLYHLSNKTSTEQLVKLVEMINLDESIHGCIVQLPLPKHIDVDLVVDKLNPEKDVDGFHPMNIGRMSINRDCFIAATPYGIKLLLEHYEIPTEGKHIVILGKSMIVGQPLMTLLSNERGPKGTVTVCDQYTPDITVYTKMADIIVVATGVHHLLRNPDDVKQGVVIIDVGIHKIKNKLEGDVDFEALSSKASYITPVPGGVGPMTVVSLLLNTWKAYKNFSQH